MNTNIITRQTCRVCGSKSLTSIIDIGDHCLSSVFAFEKERSITPQRKVPLRLMRCDSQSVENACGLLQLEHTVPPSILYQDYAYESGINDTMKEHLAGIVDQAEGAVHLNKDDLVVDIGCNDGTLLQAYQPAGIRLLGVDPSENIADTAQKKGVSVLRGLFSRRLMESFTKSKAKVITSIAMLYDLEDPVTFVRDVAHILHREGVWILEQSYLPSMLGNGSYDTICHEHLAYYSFSVVERLLDMAGLEALDVDVNGSNGGSLRVVAGHMGRPKSAGGIKRLRELRAAEFDMELDTEKPYHMFKERAEELGSKLVEMLTTLQNNKKIVHGYGASTKGNTILQYIGCTKKLIPFIADRNPHKHGKETIGTRIPIISEEQSRELKPDYYLLLPWHFLKECKARETEFLKRGGKFIVPLPKVRTVGTGA